MAANPAKPKLLVIVGPTASGKSELAMRLAKKLNGEVISADSRTIYKGMDIGTAKPSSAEQQEVKHWGLDLIDPDQKFSAKQFKDYSVATIEDIHAREKLPFLVGGTGLYIDAVVFNYDFDSSNESNPLNPRHRLRKGSSKQQPGDGVLMVGLDPGKVELQKRIEARARKIIGDGVIAEVEKLGNKYGRGIESLKTPGYKPVLDYLAGRIDEDQLAKDFIQNDLQLAKKQRTWFKRNPHTQWFTGVDEAEHFILELLNT